MMSHFEWMKNLTHNSFGLMEGSGGSDETRQSPQRSSG